MPKRTVNTKFYTFSQNNSGGSFLEDEEAGIGQYVIVEATSEKDAISRAEQIGLYFDGAGDCECCGNRWSDSYIEGTNKPMIYETDVSNGKYKTTFGWGLDSYIHYMDGTIKTVKEI